MYNNKNNNNNNNNKHNILDYIIYYIMYWIILYYIILYVYTLFIIIQFYPCWWNPSPNGGSHVSQEMRTASEAQAVEAHMDPMDPQGMDQENWGKTALFNQWMTDIYGKIYGKYTEN